MTKKTLLLLLLLLLLIPSPPSSNPYTLQSTNHWYRVASNTFAAKNFKLRKEIQLKQRTNADY